MSCPGPAARRRAAGAGWPPASLPGRAAPAALAPTSLALAGAGAADRGALLVAILAELEHWYRRWAGPADGSGPPGDPNGSGLRAEYLRWCSTIGTAVVVHLPGGAKLTGTAAGIDSAGCLVVATDSGTTAVSAGDVVHLRRRA